MAVCGRCDCKNVLYMRKIDDIIIHCTATAEGRDVSVADIRRWHKARALVVLGVYIVVNESGFGMLADNSTKTILIPAIIMIFVMAEVLIRKMLDVWKDAKESAEIFAEKEREEKEEERRRLYFPGNYTKLFYQMVWHNFKYDWKDYGLLLF